ncbi:MAG: 16S rRNA processing protein RimM [Ruminococcus sp.]|nr:16S rRNA processing protein RimM [Ruminococcus sp.]
MNNLLEAGKIVAVFGLKGEIKVQPWTDTPDFLCEFDTLYYKSGTPVEIEHSRTAKNIVVMKIKGVDSVEDAQKLRNRVLYIDRQDVELEEGCYFIQDLIGLRVVDAGTDREYGILTDVSETGANDVYHIKSSDGKMYYIPAIPDVVKETDIEGGVMRITPLDGLFDNMEEVR